MSGASRCDEILRLIDEVLGESERVQAVAPAAGQVAMEAAAVPVTVQETAVPQFIGRFLPEAMRV